MGHPPFIPYRRGLKVSAQSLRRDPTAAERKLWFEFLRGLSVRFTRQKPLGHYIADFYCASRLLAIEVDDERRTRLLQAQGIRVIRFTNIEVMEQFEGVCQRSTDAIEKPEPPARFARDPLIRGSNPKTR